MTWFYVYCFQLLKVIHEPQSGLLHRFALSCLTPVHHSLANQIIIFVFCGCRTHTHRRQLIDEPGIRTNKHEIIIQQNMYPIPQHQFTESAALHTCRTGRAAWRTQGRRGRISTSQMARASRQYPAISAEGSVRPALNSRMLWCRYGAWWPPGRMEESRGQRREHENVSDSVVLIVGPSGIVVEIQKF
jgi:hypothetical protein